MSTRYKIDPYKTQGGVLTGLEGINIPEDFELPPCGIEDLDRALFKLFNEDMPLFYEIDGNMKRIPCIFASGERAFILRRKEPLRDRRGALILPLVSILRSGIEQDPDHALSPGDGLLTIRKKLADENRVYKRQVNLENLRGQSNIEGGVSGPFNASLGICANNVYEIITIPVPRFFKATYEVTFWAQYLQQMNNIVEAFISSYNIGPARSFKIESDKGYWFLATVEPTFSDSSNFDGYQDDERMIKTSVTVHATGYIINPKYPGAPSPLRRYISAPKITFETTDELPPQISSSVLPSNNPDDYIFDDLNTVQYPLPGMAVGLVDTDGPEYSVNVGGQTKDNKTAALKMLKASRPTVNMGDPFGESTVKAAVKAKNLAKGETVYIIIDTLNQC